MSEAAVSTLEQLDSNLRDIDAVLDLVSVTPGFSRSQPTYW